MADSGDERPAEASGEEALSSRLAAGAFVLLGAYTLLVQIVLVRECFVLFSGNELSVAVQLGLWLVFTGTGGLAGSRLSAQISGILFAALPLTGIWAVFAVRAAPVVLAAAGGHELEVGWAVLSLLSAQAPLNLVAGALFPAAWRRFAVRGGADIGRFYMYEALGGAAAGMVFTFVLAGRVPGVTVVFAASAMAGGYVVALTGGPLRILAAAGGLAMIATVVFGSPARQLDAWWWQAQHPGLTHAAAKETRYQRLDLAERDGQLTLFSNGMPATHLGDLEQLAGGALGADLFLALHPDPRRVLVAGNGAPGLVSRMLEHSIERLTYVMPDPAVADMVFPAAGIDEASRLRLFHGDGRSYLDRTSERFDVIVFDLPAPATAAANRFFTVEAFQAVRERLQPDGTFVVALSSSSHYLAGDAEALLASVFQALECAFAKVSVLAGEEMVFTGGRTVPPLDETASRFAGRDVPVRLNSGRVIEDAAMKRVVFEALYEPLFDPFRIEQQSAALDTKEIAPNSDAKPIAYYLNLRRWVRETGCEPLRALFVAAQKAVSFVRRYGLWIAAAGVAFAGLLGRRARSSQAKRFVLAGAMFTSGLAGMLGQLALLFAYQNVFGSLYWSVGALFACYMIGLVAGSAIARDRFRTAPNRRSALRVLRCMMALTCLAGLGAGAARWMLAFLGAVFLYALALGLEYPVANRTYYEDLDGKRAAGILHGMDHLGAAVAAFMGGAVVLPQIDPGTTLICIACVHVTVFSLFGAGLQPFATRS